jgi:hypothetical protein
MICRVSVAKTSVTTVALTAKNVDGRFQVTPVQHRNIAIHHGLQQ